jgi:hypothetical protein
MLQAAFAVGAGVVVARILRNSPHALWAAPLAIIAVRLLLDPLLYSYYLAGPKALVLVGAALGASRLGVPRRDHDHEIREQSLA